MESGKSLTWEQLVAWFAQVKKMWLMLKKFIIKEESKIIWFFPVLVVSSIGIILTLKIIKYFQAAHENHEDNYHVWVYSWKQRYVKVLISILLPSILSSSCNK